MIAGVQQTFDDYSARLARDEAMARVDGAADPEWRKAALAAIEAVARRQPTVHADDVAKELLSLSKATTRDGRAMGPVFMRAKRLGWIKPSDSFRPAARVTHHATPRRVWQSLICEVAR